MIVPESEIITILKKSRKHSDLIKSIQYIPCTDKPLILTGSTDRMVHLINMDSQIVGTLKQGYKNMPNYLWNFPINNFLKDRPERLTHMERVLMEVREQRDKDLSHKKRKEIELVQDGTLSGFGFAGSQLMGMTSTSGMQGGYNTQQPGIPGKGMGGAGYNTQGSDSAFNTYGQAFQTNTSQFSMDPYDEKARRNMNLKQRARMVSQRDANMELKKASKEAK